MLIHRYPPRTGYCFAWTPKQTPDGTVWLEHVRFEWIDNEFGGWRYERLHFGLTSNGNRTEIRE